MNRTSLALEVSRVLELPIYHRHDKAATILRVIVKSIARALQRGESVSVRGFGIFTVRERVPIRCYVQYFYGRKRGARQLISVPAKKYVHFQPSKVLVRMVNHDHK